MKYSYEGYNRVAKVVRGTVEAGSKVEATAQLREKNIRPTKLKLISGTPEPSINRSVPKKSQAPKMAFSIDELFSNPKPDVDMFAVFIRQLATMQGAGIPLVQSLSILAEQSENKAFGGILTSVQTSIEEGQGFADSLRRHPRVFDDIFINLVAAGEVSGSMEAILNRLSIYYEKSAALKRKIVSAMTYPAFTLVAVLGVLIVMLVWVVPTFENMFKQNNAELPYMTQVIIDASHYIRDNAITVFGGLVAVIGLILYFLKSKEAKKILDPILLKVPLFGPVFLKAAVARFARTLATMIQAGVPFLESLEITAKVAGNTVIQSAILATKDSVTEGNSIAAPLEAAKIFPKMVIGMVSVGEQTGALEKMLLKVAEFYEDEVDNTVGSLTSILEPLMIVIVGAVVAGILIPLYLPVFKLGDIVGG